MKTTKPAQGYVLRDRVSNDIVKFGETTRGFKRYTRKYLEQQKVAMDFLVKGTKKEMHEWQHNMIIDYKNSHNGLRPRLNKSDW